MTATVDDVPDEQLDVSADRGMPQHVAIIMDGNGRWAASRGMPRTEGHRNGVKTVRDIVRQAGELGIGYLTLFAFSSENWSRPPSEVKFLMGLLRAYVRSDLKELKKNNVRIRVIGSREDLDPGVRRLLEDAEDATAECSGLELVLAFNYGARDELTRAVRKLSAQVASGGKQPDAITGEDIEACLDTAGMPDPDLIIRTSGEQRLSNFLLWQAAYAEFYFAPMHWPDFDRNAFDQALSCYKNRERRFGGLGTAVST
ncbi:isoprenyl transferase [Pseudovibrio sp. SPO723]|uniref:isoprenyl transferase n=1 Tax=Nesiotobacter zosterae TaxID=392721 RepID=UPI0029C32300|nr:isoprenyl transferase [Pseudovibrio sp. SPO723]MDX5592731.1 isoprenyl transferase [Pseudovibrio sp. SPO723]